MTAPSPASAALSLFVTGTDTEIGKTFVSAALLRACARAGLRAAGMKPVAAGAVERDGAWHNDDADQLDAASNAPLPGAIRTPYLLHEAAAPHIAAARESVALDIARILACHQAARARADIVVVEGVGGFRVPLNDAQDTADLARALHLPIVLVVGVRLGCISHALLTAEAIAARGLALAGWVANRVDPAMTFAQENIDALRTRLAAQYDAPLIGVVPHLPARLPDDAENTENTENTENAPDTATTENTVADTAATHLDIDTLLSRLRTMAAPSAAR